VVTSRRAFVRFAVTMPTTNATLDALVDAYGIVVDDEDDGNARVSSEVSVDDARRRKALDAVLRAAGFETYVFVGR